MIPIVSFQKEVAVVIIYYSNIYIIDLALMDYSIPLIFFAMLIIIVY